MPSRTSQLRLLRVGAVVLAALAAAAPGAHAGLLPSCAQPQVEHPFTRWLDVAPYVLVPGGSFETGAPGWSLTGGAQVSAGNEPWRVHNAADAGSLALRPGSSATSAGACVTPTYPTLRFFARSSGSLLLSALRVDVVFATTAGLLRSLPVGIVPALGTWQATLPYVFAVNDLSLLDSAYGTVSFRFTPLGPADWQIDDVYVDPWSKG